MGILSMKGVGIILVNVRQTPKRRRCGNIKTKYNHFWALHQVHQEDERGEIRMVCEEIEWLYLYSIIITCFNSFASASIHYYENQPFIPQSNAFFFHGGSEGLYASNPHPNNNNIKPHNGDSFIRFETVSFQRTAESAEKQNSMQSRTGLIEAIVFKVKDRERIGGVFLNSSSICCTPELSRMDLALLERLLYTNSRIILSGHDAFRLFLKGRSKKLKWALYRLK